MWLTYGVHLVGTVVGTSDDGSQTGEVTTDLAEPLDTRVDILDQAVREPAARCQTLD